MPHSRLVVDGASCDVSIGPDRSLLHVLREELGVTAPKYGCGEGECGACTVLLDGKPVAACVTPIGEALGRVLTTASGLGGTALLHPIQRALADVGAMECGYCTPGMATAAAALLARIPDPDDAAIRVALQGHICRCGAYQRIIQAVHRAAELARRPAEPLPAAPLGTALAQLRRPAVPWDLDEDRDYFAILPDGLVAVLAPESVPPEAWSVSGGAWIHVGVDGEVTAFTGKVDFGQGNRAGLTRLVADELGISPTRVDLVMGDTDLCPFDEGTFGSLSTPEAGAVLRATAAAVREFLRGELPEPGSRHCIMVEDAGFDPQPTSSAEPSPRPIGRARDAATGARRFTSDIALPGMLHGAVLRPPAAGATLRSADTAAAAAIPGVVVVSDGAFCGAAAADPLTARRAIEAVRAEWDTPSQPSETGLADHLRAHPAESEGWGGAFRDEAGKVDRALASAPIRVRATYTTAYIAHVPLESRTAVAKWERKRLTVWTGTQRPFAVREEVAGALGIAEADVRIIVSDTGAGFGGKHTGEAAVEAARLARAARKPVKVKWSREEEFSAAYFRPAAVIDVDCGATPGGMITAWDVLNVNSGSAGIDTPYAIANRRLAYQPAVTPLRQGSYRALAATANHFARECAVDELAARLEMDPVEFRLRNLGDERLADVLRAATDRAGWPSPGRGTALGIAVGIEKDARVATCVEIRVDDDGLVEVLRLITAFDCGRVVSPEDLTRQIEGAAVMGLGGALFEAIHFEGGRILNPRLSQYRLPRFSDTPAIEVVLIDRPDEPSAGAGETPIVAVAPALGNAIFTATGIRLRAMPLIPSGRVPPAG